MTDAVIVTSPEALRAIVRAAVDEALAARDAAPAVSYLTAAQVAERLGMHEKSVRRAVKPGGLVAHRFGGAYRFRPADVDRWCHEQTAKAESTKRSPRKAA